MNSETRHARAKGWKYNLVGWLIVVAIVSWNIWGMMFVINFNPHPVGAACTKGDFDKVRALVLAGEDPDGRSNKFTCLYLTLMKGQYEVSEFLLKHGADPDFTVHESTIRQEVMKRKDSRAIKLIDAADSMKRNAVK